MLRKPKYTMKMSIHFRNIFYRNFVFFVSLCLHIEQKAVKQRVNNKTLKKIEE